MTAVNSIYEINSTIKELPGVPSLIHALTGMRKESSSGDHGLQVSRFPFRKVVVRIPWEADPKDKELKEAAGF